MSPWGSLSALAQFPYVPTSYESLAVCSLRTDQPSKAYEIIHRHGAHQVRHHRRVMDAIVPCGKAAVGRHSDQCSGPGHLIMTRAANRDCSRCRWAGHADTPASQRLAPIEISYSIMVGAAGFEPTTSTV